MDRKSLMATGSAAALVGVGSWFAGDGSFNSSAFSLVTTLIGILTTGLGFFKDKDQKVDPSKKAVTWIDLVQLMMADGKLTPDDAVHLLTFLRDKQQQPVPPKDSDSGIPELPNIKLPDGYLEFKRMMEYAYQAKTWMKNFKEKGPPVYYTSTGVWDKDTVSVFIFGEDPRTPPAPVA